MKLLWIMLLCLAFTLFAQSENDLYQVELKSNDFSDALQILYNRLKPGTVDRKNPIILKAKPELYVMTNYPQLKANQTKLITFDKDKLIPLFKEAGLDPWIAPRPEILTWISLIKDAKMTYLYKKDYPELFHSVCHALHQKGLACHFPSRANVDKMNLLEDTLYEAKNLRHLALSKPNDPSKATLWIELYDSTTEKVWFEWWHFYYKDQLQSGKRSGRAKTGEVGDFSVAGMSRYLANLTQKAPETTDVYVRIGHILTTEDYWYVDSILKRMPGILGRVVNSVTEDTVLYTLKLKVSPNLLHQRLAQEFDSIPSDPEEGIMTYRIRA